jgi:hypothetical protein
MGFICLEEHPEYHGCFQRILTEVHDADDDGREKKLWSIPTAFVRPTPA